MELLIQIDKELFLFLNSLHNQVFDFIMFWVTNKYVWIPLYIFIIIYCIRKPGLHSALVLISIAVLVLLVDQTTSAIMKPYFERLRPCHDPSISLLTHLVTSCGGKYGFVSGHAANTFSVATFYYLLFNSKPWSLLLLWAAIVSYSRIYVGVHYPLDVLIGALFGAIMGWLIFTGYQQLSHRIFKPL